MTIPALNQRIPNPCPRVVVPEWLLKKVRPGGSSAYGSLAASTTVSKILPFSVHVVRRMHSHPARGCCFGRSYQRTLSYTTVCELLQCIYELLRRSELHHGPSRQFTRPET